MLFEHLEAQILELLNDKILADTEKLELRELILDLAQDKKSFVRNKAFNIAKQQILAEPQSAMQVINWLQRFMSVMDNSQAMSSVVTSAHFSPGTDCKSKLLDLLCNAKESVEICVFTISDNQLSEAIINTHKRKVKVRILTDNEKAHDRGSDVQTLIDSGIDLRIDESPFHMHHKFMVVDSRILVNGSFNWTSSATMNNEENIMVSGELSLVKAFQDKFDELWHQYLR